MSSATVHKVPENIYKLTETELHSEIYRLHEVIAKAAGAVNGHAKYGEMSEFCRSRLLHLADDIAASIGAEINDE